VALEGPAGRRIGSVFPVLPDDARMAAADGDAAAFDWLTLDADEAVLWTGSPDRRTLVPTMVVGIPLCLVLVGIPIVVGEYLRVTNTHYVVTSNGLYTKTGILSRDVQKIDFDKVQNISYSQGAIGTRFGFGTVDVSTAGGSGVEMQFRSVPDPRAVQQRINERIRESRGRGGDGETSKADLLEDILAELRAIREATEGGPGGGASDGTAPPRDQRPGDDRRSSGPER
jgi:membrane protein YdbS with pleckstrin-like domain